MTTQSIIAFNALRFGERLEVGRFSSTKHLNAIAGKIFGESGITVVIEEFLQGQEVSVFGFTDGRTISPLVAACDYKKIGNGDVGLNTGGMGCFGPPDFWTEELHRIVLDMVFEPVVNQLKKEGSTYKGILYAGLMITSTGIKTLEFNCRFGDPEAQIIVSLVRSDLLEVMKDKSRFCS